MKKDKRITLGLNKQLHDKLHYIAKCEYRSANGEILYLLRQYIDKFEAENGKIPAEEDEPTV